MRNKILHVMHNDKFCAPFIGFIDGKYNIEDHHFIIFPGISKDIIPLPVFKNVIYIDESLIERSRIGELLKYIIPYHVSADIIIIHGIFRRQIIYYLRHRKDLLKKCYWVVWGGDLYEYKNAWNSLSQIRYHLLKKSIVKRMHGLITFVKGDYDLAVRWYGVKGKFIECFMYQSNVFREIDLPPRGKNEKLFIQVGNSGDESNNHLEMLNKLSVYKDKNIEIICPLSYGGDDEYRQEIINMGQTIFGTKFNALITLLPYDQYLKVLSKIDIAIFNHDRQQAMGNIITLLGMGKVVYIRRNITTWDTFHSKGIKVYDINDFVIDQSFSKEVEENKKIVKSVFSENQLFDDLNKIFSGD